MSLGVFQGLRVLPPKILPILALVWLSSAVISQCPLSSPGVYSFALVLLSPGVCHFHKPHLLFLNHSDVRYVGCQTLVSLDLKIS